MMGTVCFRGGRKVCKSKKGLTLQLISILFFSAVCGAPAQTGYKELPDAVLKTTSVAAFKNGLGFFVRQGTAHLSSGQARIPFVPQATLGTLWLAPNDPGTSIEELVAYKYKVSKERGVTTIEELLRNDTGKTVTILYNNKEYTGQVLGFTDATNTPESSIPGIPGPALTLAPRTGLLLFKSENKVFTMNPQFVSLVSQPDTPNTAVKEPEDTKALRFTLKGAGDTANLTMGYLQKGLGWTPSYSISLQDDKTARITMQAVLVNDAEDLVDADVFFVVGVPNFRFADKLSPMALQQSLADFMQSAAQRDFSANQFSNALMNQRVASLDNEVSPTFSATVGELEGAPEEDLFLYTRPRVSLAKGERAAYNIFAANLDYEHLYEWEVTDSPRVDIYGNPVNSNASSDDRFVNTVWHSLRLKNGSKFPWTSAPALVISAAKPVAQDTLSYTPKGATTDLKLTIATDVRTDKKEVEVDRQLKVAHRYGSEYDAVTVEGTLKIKNYKNKDIPLPFSEPSSERCSSHPTPPRAKNWLRSSEA